MIKLEHLVLASPEQMEFIIEGLRNPLNSWDRSDSFNCEIGDCDTCDRFSEYGCPNLDPGYHLGYNDHSLMQRLANAGTDHRKFMRMMSVYVRITAPLYWWKEFDTYKIGTVANSCSTMHKIQEKEFTLEDFSCEHLGVDSLSVLRFTIKHLNRCRDCYIESNDKDDWWQMIQLLPSSYNQTRNVMMNYEVLANIYKSRKNHKLDEWREFCNWIESLPYSELICGEEHKDEPVTPNEWRKKYSLKPIESPKTVNIKDLVEVTRCKDCKYYISEEDMKNNEMYKDYNNVLGYDGLCISTDKWTDETDFCSSGKDE